MFNPLDHIEDAKKPVSESSAEVSTSSLDFASETHCPKCGAAFDQAVAARSIPVNYCAKCRVAIPLKD